MLNNNKLVLLGDSAIGKSSLVLRFARDTFLLYSEPTIGAAFLVKRMKYKDKEFLFELWDTAGQERYHALAPIYYRNAQFAIVAYDITNQESFLKAKKWVKELKFSEPQIVILLSGNKCDLEMDRVVPYEMAEEYANEAGILFAETSAKRNINVEKIFQLLVDNLPEPTKNATSSLLLSEEVPKKTSCCL